MTHEATSWRDTHNPTFDRPVDRSMVHRRAAAEVFLTGAHQISQREWAFDVQISRGHVLVPPHTSEIPLTLCIEALRQMGLYMAHSGYAIPTDWAFTLQKTTFAWLPDARVAFPEFGPLELTTHLVVTGETLRKGTVSGLEASLEFYVGTEKVAVGTGELRCISPVHYRALRRGAPAPHDVVRRYDPTPVRELRETPDGYLGLVGYNHANPFFFDHPVDHVPGMLLLHTMTHLFDLTFPLLTARSVDLTCDSFPEFDPPVSFRTVRGADGTTLDVVFSQNGREIAEGRVTGINASSIAGDSTLPGIDAGDPSPVVQGAVL
ncbi:AfsA-related hotdog domain-containing protein [Sanguibacter antarcticus]|nr:AfsA-related hotdog domain-containing protein [Sanguibacter antarcticus]